MNPTTVILSSGGVQYDVEEAQVSIDDLIAVLEGAREEGATHVVMESGNYRGARWASVVADIVWPEEEQ